MLLYKLRDCNENNTVISRIASATATRQHGAALPGGRAARSRACAVSIRVKISTPWWVPNGSPQPI